MTYDLVPAGDHRPGPAVETTAYRLGHFRVFDEDGFRAAFAVGPPDNATLASVSAELRARLADRFGSKDLVVLLGARVVAVVRAGADGRAEVTTFA